MKDISSDKVIVILTKRILMLEEELSEMTIECKDAVDARDNLKGNIKDIQEVLDYCGHPGNTVGVLKSRLKGN